MLLCVSSGGSGGGWVVEEQVELSGEVALEGSADFFEGASLGCAAFDVGAGAGVGAHAGEQDGVQGAVQAPVPAAVEAVAGGLAAGGWEGAGAGDGGEGGLGVDASGVGRSEEHTSELQSRGHLGCRLLL